MATITRRCKADTCRRRFKVSAQTRRVYCEECRPPRLQAGTLVDSTPKADRGAPGALESRLLADLQAAERHETVDGLAALIVARDVDAGRVAPAQKPRVLQQLAQLRTVALAGTARPAAPDRLDEVAARRVAKAAAAS